jgi:predicted O-linked N-acetylglucosamine transferase (SPINDLY family)
MRANFREQRCSRLDTFRGVSYRHQRIRIAYLSADFYEHATAFLMAGVFEHHDKGRFETYAFSYGANDRSATRARLERRSIASST